MCLILFAQNGQPGASVFCRPSRPALGPTLPLLNKYCGYLRGVKRPGREVAHRTAIVALLPVYAFM